jgi:autotransporter-associated beta strand protein
MKTIDKANGVYFPARAAFGLLIGFSLIFVTPAGRAGTQTWTGAGGDRFWHDAANWAGEVLPSAGDSLVFVGTVGLVNTNNFSLGTRFNGITFNGPGGFNLWGNSFELGGGITNRQVVTLESINVPISLTASQDIDVVGNGSLLINGAISGAGGITKTSNGLVTLAGPNTFTGPVSILAGALSIGAAGNLGASTQLTLNAGALQTTGNLSLNSGMGILLGPGSGAGYGTITVNSATTLSYGGVIADNTGGGDSLIKNGFGTLTLSGANTYTGGTSNRVGTLTLDFTQPGSPAANIISPASALMLGGENAGFGALNYAQLNMFGKNAAVSSQAFNGTHITFASSVIQAANGVGGTANLLLGALDHDPGGTLTIISPVLTAGGNVTTTSTNVNGILGGWATLGDGSTVTITGNGVANQIVLGTNFASVDAGGNIVNFTGYRSLANGELIHNISTAATNLLITPNVTGDMVVNNDNAGTLTDVNAIQWNRTDNNVTLKIGIGNTLRLGRYGAIFKPNTTAGLTWLIGETAAGGNGPDQNIGTLTAGGADNTPGEIIVDVNNTSSSSGTVVIDAKITDNGTGPVTLVKTGAGSMKLRGHNSYSGGTFLLQGRVQFVGGEGGVGTGNADGGGTGPIYILPGCYLFPSGTAPTSPVTNAVFIAGNGTAGEPLGAIRGTAGWLFNGPWTLIGDTTIGGNGGASGAIGAKLSGPFNLSLCSPVTVNGTVSLTNSANDWSGATTLNARNNAGANVFLSGNSEIIPNGFGKGNVVMNGFGSGTITWNMNGFNETINGLSSSGVGANCFIINNGASPSLLTVGDNDQSGTFAGALQDGGSSLTLTKIGGGVQTLTGANTYSGPTSINGGTLALSGAGSISISSFVQVNAGASFDVSGVTGGFSSFNPIGLNGGTLIGNTSPNGILTLGITNSALTLSVDPAVTNIVAATLGTGGANVINVGSVFNVPSYPATFTLVKYTGAIGGAGFNFSLGTVPTPTTAGYVSNDTANAAIELVLTSGPKALTWSGLVNYNWDVATTTNWSFGGNPAVFNNLDSALFDDTAATNTVNLATVVQPGAITVNASGNYTFVGGGAISGSALLVKGGSGTLSLFETGGDTFSGGVSVNSGTLIFGDDSAIAGGVTVAAGATVQVGTNGGVGELPAGAIANSGILNFERGADLVVPNSISGGGTLLKNDASVLTLSGANGSLTGAVQILQGTLRAGSSTALGTADSGTTNISGGTLDINGQQLTTEPITVSGAGVGGLGAIINSGADNINALGNVTLAGDTIFGGTGRWDIRGGAAQLATSPPDSPYTLTKVGPNQVSLVGLTLDPGLGNISVQGGLLSVETTTTSLGDAAHTLTVAAGATLQLYNSSTAFSKNFIFNGTATNTALICGNGIANAFGGPVSLNGPCLFNAASGTTLTFNGPLSGGGSVVKTGGGTNLIAFGVAASYSGGTTISNGAWLVDGTLAGNVIVYGGMLGGLGTASGSVTVTNGGLSPGDPLDPQGILTIGTLALNNATATFDLLTTPGPGNAQITVTGGLTVTGTNTLAIVPPPTMNVGDIYTLIQYGGTALPASATNNFIVTTAQPGFSFSLVDPSTTPGLVKIRVDSAIGVDTWTGATSATWDTTTTNWTRNGVPSTFNNRDFANFDDTSTANTVGLSGALNVSGITMNNVGHNYSFVGTGSLTGSGGLELDGGGALTVANQGSNNFTGPITINGGVLQVGNGSTNGNLGPGVLTNDSALVFNRTGNITVNNSITGPGSLTNIGPGVVTLSGANSFDGQVQILQGTLQVNSSSALGTTNGGTLIASGATLDLGGATLAANALNLGREPILVSGAGVGGKGAIVNNSANSQQNALQNVTLTGDTTFGALSRWDIRGTVGGNIANGGTNSLLSAGGNAYNLTKVGTNRVELAGTQVDTNLANISVQAGILGLQGSVSSLGNPTNTLTVFSNAQLAFFQVSNILGKVLMLSNTASILNESGANTFGGPVTLQGSNIFNVSGGSLSLNNSLSGPGTLSKIGTNALTVTAASSYAGSTYVNAGTLALAGSGTLGGSSLILITNSAILDVTARSDQQLTLAAGQTLRGNGTLSGNLNVGLGANLSPGQPAAIGTLTVSNGTVTLAGTTTVRVNRSPNGTNDSLRCPSGITLGGGLIVTNIGTTLRSGDTFPLFSGPLNGSITPAGLPPLWPGLTWNTVSLNTVGSISVTGALVPPLITDTGVTGTNFFLTGSGGVAGATYYVLGSTNAALPLVSWTRLTTNVFSPSGGFAYTNATAKPQQFFTIQAP